MGEKLMQDVKEMSEWIPVKSSSGSVL